MATNIFKRGGIYWIRYTGIDGKQKRESIGRDKSFKDAELELANRKKAIREGKEPESKKIPNVTFRELSEKYLYWIKGRQNSAKTKGYIIGQLLSVFGDTQLRRFGTELVDQLQTDLINNHYKPASNNKILTILKHMFSRALEWELITDDTLKRIRKVKPLRFENSRLRYLSINECHSLINACDNHLRPILITALNAGMRKGEILGLKWDNVDFRHNRILLDKTKNGERREIPINETLKITLQGLTRRLDLPYVFFDSATGKPYQDIKRSFSTALRKAGITDIHLHALSHTFASQSVMSGVDTTKVSKL